MPDDVLTRLQGSTTTDISFVCRTAVEAALARLDTGGDDRPRMILGLTLPDDAGIEVRIAEGPARVPGDGWVLGAMRPGDLHDAGRRAVLIDRLTVEATRVLLREAACRLPGLGHVHDMPRRSPPAPPEPDLFGLAQPPRASTPPASVALPAPVVAPLPPPAPVARSVTLAEIEAFLPGWSEAELTRLRDLAAAELARRVPPAAAGDAPRSGPRQRRPELLAARLTPAQLGMVRAAAEAGIGPLRIARQFALPLAAVQQVLDARRRG